MDWTLGYSARYTMTQVDPSTWRDIATFRLTGGTIMRSESGLMSSANVNLTEAIESDTWVRIWLDAEQDQSGAHEALFTGVLSLPSVDQDGRRRTYTAECYSVLKPAEDILLPRGWFAPKDRIGAELIAELLEGFAPVSFEPNSPRLATNIVAVDGENRLSMAQKVAEAIGWRIRINGYGEIGIRPQDDLPRIEIGQRDSDIIETQLTVTKDMFSIPNVFRATNGSVSAVYYDKSEASQLSTVNRGREIWAEELEAPLSGAESIMMYAKRRLRELQQISETVTYTRRYLPDIYPGDLIGLHCAESDIIGTYRIEHQQIELGYAGRTSEEVSPFIREDS